MYCPQLTGKETKVKQVFARGHWWEVLDTSICACGCLHSVEDPHASIQGPLPSTGRESMVGKLSWQIWSDQGLRWLGGQGTPQYDGLHLVMLHKDLGDFSNLTYHPWALRSNRDKPCSCGLLHG